MFSKAALIACLLLAGNLWSQDPKIPADKDPKTTPEGLTWCVLKQGDGKVKAKLGDRVTVRYTGWLEDGKVFDSTEKNGGRPATFELIPGRLIAGWILGIPMMSEGDRFKFTVPAELAYGSRARPGIPANSKLIFVVDLEKVEPYVELPVFKPGNPERQRKTPSGLVYEVLKEGSGPAPGPAESFQVSYALWNRDGVLIECDKSQPRQPVTMSLARLGLPFFKEAIPMMKEGARWRFEVPPELCFGGRPYGYFLPANSPTVWELEILKVLRAPKFAMSPPDKLKTTKSGLKYEVIKEGTGRSPSATSQVKVHYAGWLTNGKLFDASYTRGQPATFAVNRVIKGWTEGLQLMKEGAIYKFTIPSELAYGKRGSPPTIPPDATLVFYVNLLEVLTP